MTSAIIAEEIVIQTMGQNLDGKIYAQQRMQRARSVRKLDILQICMHVNQNGFIESKLNRCVILNPQIW